MNTEIATLAGGCFWCLEAVYVELRGVESVESGYMGGKTASPSYEDVCSGDTGHAEVVQIAFDAEEISYADLLEIFFAIHDPTTPNRQGNDVGSQYRSAIFFHDAEQERIARETVNRVQASFRDPIVTEIVPASPFYKAEEYHQEYYGRVGGRNPYCTFVIDPKVAKFRRKFAKRLKEAK
ncbi:MAG TPA: peptide-methionine (S)-S-oxide reductase MsrA [Usitatibacter sp.]|nr:peptide-methionine (S)-S-oxide reductase MsrA [Usitatibacter sp.]